MKKLLLSTLLFVGLASCSKKDDSTPTPIPNQPTTVTLQAKWQVDSSYTKTPGTRTISKLQVYPAQALIWEFTTAQLLSTSAGATTPYSYTQSGNVLTFVGQSSPTNVKTITELTAKRLVITNVPDGYPAGTPVRNYTTCSR